jgi:hypothetical protein
MISSVRGAAAAVEAAVDDVTIGDARCIGTEPAVHRRFIESSNGRSPWDWRPDAVHQFVRIVVLDGGMRIKVVRTVALVLMALALGLVLGALTKFRLGYDLAVAVETGAASTSAAQ